MHAVQRHITAGQPFSQPEEQNTLHSRSLYNPSKTHKTNTQTLSGSRHGLRPLRCPGESGVSLTATREPRRSSHWWRQLQPTDMDGPPRVYSSWSGRG